MWTFKSEEGNYGTREEKDPRPEVIFHVFIVTMLFHWTRNLKNHYLLPSYDVSKLGRTDPFGFLYIKASKTHISATNKVFSIL